MEYTGITNKKTLSIDKIYSVHYFEYANTFVFKGESHDFWELICVDKGEVNITAGEEAFSLKANDLVFHEPNEFHTVEANGKSAPNLVVISFSCQDEIIQFFRKKHFQIDQTERYLLGQIILEARRCFNCRLDDPYMKTIPLKEPDIPGAEQLLFLYLEQFLIGLLRKHASAHALAPFTPMGSAVTSRQHADMELFHTIVAFFQTKLHTQITVEQICKAHCISRSHLQKIFRQYCDLGIIEYFSYMKIQEAKELIRTQSLNFTQISEKLGYTSVHYFSRQFKKVSGMTPSEYATSIKAISEQNETNFSK